LKIKYCTLFFFTLVFAGCEEKAQAEPFFKEEIVANKVETQDYSLKVSSLIREFSHPWAMEFVDEDHMLITERNGSLYYVDLKRQKLKPVDSLPEFFIEGQAGLFDIKLHPQFSANKLIYLSYAAPNPENPKESGTELMMARLELHGNKAALVDKRVIFKAMPKSVSSQHYGGRIAINDQFVFFKPG